AGRGGERSRSPRPSQSGRTGTPLRARAAYANAATPAMVALLGAQVLGGRNASTETPVGFFNRTTAVMPTRVQLNWDVKAVGFAFVVIVPCAVPRGASGALLATHFPPGSL